MTSFLVLSTRFGFTIDATTSNLIDSGQFGHYLLLVKKMSLQRTLWVIVQLCWGWSRTVSIESGNWSFSRFPIQCMKTNSNIRTETIIVRFRNTTHRNNCYRCPINRSIIWVKTGYLVEVGANPVIDQSGNNELCSGKCPINTLTGPLRTVPYDCKVIGRGPLRFRCGGQNSSFRQK